MKTISLIRHGEVEKSYRHRYNGWNNIGLSPRGIDQVRKTAEEIGSIPVLYSSDLLRCRQTIQFFTCKETVISESLREKSWGKHEGMSFDEIEASGIAYTDFPTFIKSLDGETPEIFKERVISYWQSIRTVIPHGAAILTHGGVIHQILAEEGGISLEESYHQNMVPYGTVVELTIL